MSSYQKARAQTYLRPPAGDELAALDGLVAELAGAREAQGQALTIGGLLRYGPHLLSALAARVASDRRYVGAFERAFGLFGHGSAALSSAVPARRRHGRRSDLRERAGDGDALLLSA